MSNKLCLVLSVILTATMLLAACANAAPTAAPVQPTTAPAATAAATPAETVPSQAALAEDVQLAWPAVGQAAVGSVEDGLLASSSDNEELRPTASMAKVITALAIMEKQPFELGQAGQTYTITREDIANMSAYIAEGGSVLPLLIGTELTQYQAMQRMLIASDNNMADIKEFLFCGNCHYFHSSLWLLRTNN